jgi:Fe-S-cluster-containing dehydrogenase component
VKAFRVNIHRCNGCYNCQIACKDEHSGNDWTPYAKPQPDWGHFWLKITDNERGTVGAGLPENPKIRMSSKVFVDYVPVMCQHCLNAPCIKACPYAAIYTRDDGLVIIDIKKCTGCRLCISGCPYGVIYFNDGLALAQKCTGCAHLLDRGAAWTYGTRCADQCPTEAILFGEDSELNLTGTETFRPELGVTTRVHYLNLPKRFIGGTVYDPATKEVVIGATCTLSGASTATATTDGWGDFWFDKLPVGTFTVTISAAGKTATKAGINTEKDVNLGDIPLS